MFRHKGGKRKFSHNIRLAAMLSFVAGVVNVIGVMALQVLTTNVTGHFAYFSENIILHQYAPALVFLLYIFSFFVGAFVSNLLIEIHFKHKDAYSYLLPMSLEIVLLVGVAFLGAHRLSAQTMASVLLFAMGLQNALVTKVSNAVVRTTHLTGLFTDLGIELSQLLFYKKRNRNNNLLKQKINLKLIIILCFFVGCVLGGFLYHIFFYKTILVGVLFLLIALFYNRMKLNYYYLKKKLTR